jgi:hypothetical protein
MPTAVWGLLLGVSSRATWCMAELYSEAYRSLAKYYTTWGYHLWGKHPRLLCEFQAFLAKFWPKWHNIQRGVGMLLARP